MGRQRKYLTKQQAEEVERLAAVLTQDQIANYFGISSKTFRAIKDRQPDILTAYKRGKAKSIESVANNLISQSREGNVAATIFYLKTQAGWRETEKDDTKEDESKKLIITFSE